MSEKLGKHCITKETDEGEECRRLNINRGFKNPMKDFETPGVKFKKKSQGSLYVDGNDLW